MENSVSSTNKSGLSIRIPSKITLLWAAFIIISASFMRQLFDLLVSYTSRDSISAGLLVTGAAAASAIIYLCCSLRSSRRKIIVLLLLAALAWLCIRMPLPEERVHILKYGLLGYLFAKDLMSGTAAICSIKQIVYSIAFGLLIAMLDEGFQAILPYRVGDIRDVAFDLISFVAGMIICINLRR